MDIKDWVSKEREENTRDCSKDEAVDFDYPTNVEDFNDLLETYQQIKANYNENYLGRNMTLDRLTVMDDVSALADELEEFANFLFQENTDWHAYTFFILYIRQDNADKWYGHRQKFLIFSPDLFKFLP